MVATAARIQLLDTETQALLDWAEQVHQSDETLFHQAKALATRLGAHYRNDGLTEIGFWAPELGADMVQPKNIYLEIFTPKKKIDPTRASQKVIFRRDYVELHKQGEYFWGVLSGMKPGTRDELGSFYWLRYLDMNSDEVRVIGDCLAYSLPYGVYAPAELYDMDGLQRRRADLDYFAQGDTNDDGVVQVHSPGNILQLHVNTASPNGYLSGLTAVYQGIANKLKTQAPLTPAEQNFLGYDAVQLLPIEPTVEYLGAHELGHGFFILREDDMGEMDPETEEIEREPGDINVTLKKPDTQNWGYDIVIFGSSATNPSVLETLRPDELVEFIATLHNFPTGPIQVIFDIVYGHADNQGISLLNGRFLKGPNMYGQDVNHQNPTVRAILLEMQRRKNNTGVDGIRVDGAQDFKFFNPLSGRVEYDDNYLSDMAEVLQQVGDRQRRLFSIFEDGRPWPAENWEEISTYRDIVEFKPDAFQWGPLIFAHNTPSLKKFWNRKWRRVVEQMQVGENWITGCGNHDTLRRGTQVDSELDINWNLGDGLPEVLNNAYDNPAIALMTYGFSPGLPMDFINCTMRSPWAFLRNTDDRYGVKVVSEEAGGFLDWQVIPETYDWPNLFPRLKAMGFTKLGELRQFVRALYDAIEETDYDLDEVAHLCQKFMGADVDADALAAENQTRKSAKSLHKLNVPDKSAILTQLDVAKLKEFARSFMEDTHDLCNVWLQQDILEADQVAFNLALRRFRRANPWLRKNLLALDRFNRIDTEEQTVFYGLRTAPAEDGQTSQHQVAMVAHMGGDPLTVTLGDWLQIDVAEWRVAVISPGVGLGEADLKAFELKDSQAVLLERVESV
ncbi:alpha-amylase [Nodosilinea sp. LEGE 07088]|uniref:glucosylglycerol hydrolase n=1 Tax=Nodosilinea sp. LEGE 07088 TaxID=2777968 RepID=UPI00188299FA|nr:glucosylglycerol hydrolase [Nodosilinea sp. LEGE 07088]MBE9137107.1 alpha-amylase [Nodosilinea sp. LEGE 07088]